MCVSPRLVGRIVGEATPTEFLFVSSKKDHPPRYEYVMVYSDELIDGQVKRVEVLAQVTHIVSRSSAYSENVDFTTLERIYSAGIDDVNVICVARTLGFLYRSGGSSEIRMPRRAIYPGNEVYLAPDELVQEFFSYPEEEGIHIGYLLSRPHIPVYVSLNGFRRHVAILAQTGAGKSYTVGVLVEEILRKGGTVIIVDPHADYVFLGRLKDGTPHPLKERIFVFRNPNSTGRYSEDSLDNVKPYTVSFSDLSSDEIADILEIPERWTNIRDVISKAVSELRKKSCGYSVEDFIGKVEEMARGSSSDAQHAKRALKYVYKLRKIRVFGDVTTSIEDMLQPMQVSVLDLSGLNDASMDYIVYRVLSEVYLKVSTGEYRYPVFVVIEEAHKFVPPKSERRTRSRSIINTIAAEGRKFGIFLIVVSQRPSKIDQDTLSQCNSQIILRVTNPVDQRAILNSSERISESLLSDLPGLNVGEAVIVGQLTKVPVLVKIRERKTMEGGADIDVVGALKRAREELEETWRIMELRASSRIEDSMISEV